ncbi:hypothetical protein K439DRAFT_1276579, partial [Ramaria rubella]
DSNDCPILMDTTGFQIWKIRMTAELHDKKVWGLVDGTEVNPGPSVTIYPSYYNGTNSWEIRDGKAHSTIVKHLSNTLIYKHVTPSQMAKELWSSWDGSSEVNKHLSKLHAADKRLASMKRHIDDEFMAFFLLHSLPKTSQFETLMTTILNSIQPNQ